MTIIQISANSNGSHSNQTSHGPISAPDGWAIIPDGMELPETFPFVGVEAVDGVVTRLTPGVVPEPPEPEEEPVPMEAVLGALLGG